VKVREALAHGGRVDSQRARHLFERALEVAEGLAGFPQPTMLSDRRAAIEGTGTPLPEGLALEARLGADSVLTGLQGAARFAAGEGRGAEGAGV
jgi:enoyl-CoA hydratase